jgi:NSS family neurotransmitter:Na+ symporter
VSEDRAPPPREQWGTSTGFVLATIGSAVGIGNIWRFSYVAGENGGGAFLIVYAVSVLLVGLPIIIGEMALGRRGAADAVAAFTLDAPRSPWRYAGWVAVLGCVLILSFYAVVAGWSLKYFTGAVSGALWKAAAAGYGGYYREFIAHPVAPVGWLFAMLALTVFVVAGGVRRGIEAANRILMPLLAFSIIVLAVYGATLPGSAKGWTFLFSPDWDAVLKGEVIVAAIGQAFFSLGVGMAVFITYSAYITPGTRIPRSAVAIAIGDTLFALVAGLAIFPAVFAFGMDPAAGPELAFITLPQIFLVMPYGSVAGIVFFGLLSAAALTSMMSLLEVPVASLLHRSPLSRRRAATLTGCVAFVLGIPSALSFGVLSDVRITGESVFDFVNQGVSNYLLPLGGVLVCLYAGWFLSRNDILSASGLLGTLAGGVWYWLLRLVAPMMILLVFLDTVGGP